jgi:hypothetical protein
MSTNSITPASGLLYGNGDSFSSKKALQDAARDATRNTVIGEKKGHLETEYGFVVLQS